MPILTYFAVAGTALLALLFYASANMEPRGPLAVTSNFEGLPPPWHGPAVARNLASTPAPAPDMNSDAVKTAAAIAGTKTAAETKTAAVTTGAAQKAEPTPKKKRHVARRSSRPPEDVQRYAW